MGLWSPIIVATITGIFALLGTYFSNKKSSELILYRMEQLEKKTDKHNEVIERTYKLEEKMEIHEEKLKVINHRISDLEKG